jgi:hypothetical protein
VGRRSVPELRRHKISLRQKTQLGRDRRCIENYRAYGHARGGPLGLSDELLDLKITLLFFVTLFTQIIRPETPLLVKSLYGLTVIDIELGWWRLSPLASRRPPQSAALTSSHWVQRVTGTVFIMLDTRLAIARAIH